MTQIKRILFSALCVLGLPLACYAHEFWIEPAQYQITSGETITAKFRNGENFEGNELAFFDRRSTRLQIVFDGEVQDIVPRNGDRPAISVAPLGDGLNILVHETQPSSLTYKTWEKFAKFAAHKDFPGIKARHEARNLPIEGFKEQYTRHVKALIGVAGASGADHAVGLKTEFIAISNIYNSNFNQSMQVNLLADGQPRADAQVEVFERAPDGTVTVTLTRTDASGLASIPTKPGHSYLLDAVMLSEPTDPNAEHVWETYWAALTFAVPAR